MVCKQHYPDWEAVYRDNVDRVYRMMVAKVGNRPDAEDLTAEVFLTASILWLFIDPTRRFYETSQDSVRGFTVLDVKPDGN